MKKKSKWITALVTPETLACIEGEYQRRIDTASDDDKTPSKSDIIREALEFYFKKHRAKDATK